MTEHLGSSWSLNPMMPVIYRGIAIKWCIQPHNGPLQMVSIQRSTLISVAEKKRYFSQEYFQTIKWVKTAAIIPSLIIKSSVRIFFATLEASLGQQLLKDNNNNNNIYITVAWRTLRTNWWCKLSLFCCSNLIFKCYTFILNPQRALWGDWH